MLGDGAVKIWPVNNDKIIIKNSDVSYINLWNEAFIFLDKSFINMYITREKYIIKPIIPWLKYISK